MKLKRQAQVPAIIPTASMADIAFLLIIFFMVIAGVEIDRTKVELPLAKIREEAEKGAAVVVLAKIKDSNTGIEELIYKFSDGKNQSQTVGGPGDIGLEATRLTYVDPMMQFVLKADGTVAYEKVDELLDTMRKGGVQKVLLLTAQKTAGEATP
jgi:biopolymer transport protein ExbD